MKSYKSLKQSVVLIALLALAAAPTRAADGTWDLLVGGTWSPTSRWVGGIVADGADSTATFNQDITLNRTITLDSDRTIGHLFFNDSGGGTDRRWTLQSNTLTLETTTGTPTINIGSQVGVPVYIASVLAGTQGFEKKGNGTLMINAAMTYTGDTVISDGNIRFNGTDDLPATTVLRMLPGANTLQMMGYSQTLGGLDGANGTVECSFNGLQTNVLTLAVAGSESYSFSGLLQDGAATSELNIVKTGTGTQVFSGANNYSGTTTVSGGTLIIDGDGTLGLVTVESGATFGGDGTLGAGLTLDDGAKFLFNGAATLSVTNGTVDLGNLSVAALVGLDDTVADGTYTLIDGAATFDFSDVQNLGAANAYDLGSGKSAYFEEGSLQVTVIPEPATLGLVAFIGFAAVVIRRRLML